MAAEISGRKTKKNVLGKGLDALIPDFGNDEAPSQKQNYFLCDINCIRPNPYQPRMRFAPEALTELSRSIKSQGVIQPLTVRKNGGSFELITGERRLRAAKMAGFSQVPVVIKSLSDMAMLEVSIVENIQRADLNPIEEAEAYHRLMTEFTLTQEEAAARVGKSRSAIANMLRLRSLPEAIRSDIMEGVLSTGHGRALLGADTPARQIAAWREVRSKKLSVRQTEDLIRRLKKEKVDLEPPEPSSEDIHFSALSEKLSQQWGTKIQIRRSGKKGRVEIAFYGDKDLQRLLDRLLQQAP